MRPEQVFRICHRWRVRPSTRELDANNISTMRWLASHSKLFSLNFDFMDLGRVFMRRMWIFAVLVFNASVLQALPAGAQSAPEAAPLSKQVAKLEETVAREEGTLLDWPNLGR